jgi:hypothetical protein
MQTLRELQLGFVAAVLEPQQAGLFGRQLYGRALSSEQRIQIYRNNQRVNLLGALEAVYPVVLKLLGADCFRGVGRRYVTQSVSRSGDIHDYGDGFAAFLAAQPELSGCPYLPDVARLEWSYHRMFHRERLPVLRPASLQQVPAPRYGELGFRLQPSACLFQSPWPVLRIWQVNQDDWRGEDGVNLDAGGVQLLVLRAAFSVDFVPVQAGEYALLQALAAGTTLAEACAQALQQDVAFDLQSVLSRHIGLGTFTHWRLDRVPSGD